MLRVQTENGWWLITHPDHARLAADFATHWGNSVFTPPTPRAEVLDAIRVHDDGWAVRDAQPDITRQGKPSAFSEDLVGKYSAFEEIDLGDYLAVRASALDRVEQRCAYAALLVSMHTYSLLTERADRSTITPDQLPLLDAFLARQLARQDALRESIRADSQLSKEDRSDQVIGNNFHLLQATDNLSLLSCVAYSKPATLLHPLPTCGGGSEAVKVSPLVPRTFRLTPYPLDKSPLTFELTARHVEGHSFLTAAEFRTRLASAALQTLTITITD